MLMMANPLAWELEMLRSNSISSLLDVTGPRIGESSVPDECFDGCL